MVAQGDVDPASLERRHRRELEHLARVGHALGGPRRDLAKLAFSAAPIVLDVDEDSSPAAHPPREHEVDQVLEGREPLALAADERAERLLLGSLAHDVEAARLAGLDLDANVEAEMTHELLEDCL